MRKMKIWINYPNLFYPKDTLLEHAYQFDQFALLLQNHKNIPIKKKQQLIASMKSNPLPI